MTSLVRSRFEEDSMNVSKKVIGSSVLVLLMILSVSSDVLGQRRNRRVFGRNNNDKKCAKFVNCHDARDGRWDGRGPNRREGLGDIIFGRSRRNRDRDRDWDRDRDRDRDRDWDRTTRRRRNRDRDRDYDRDPFWRRRY